MLYYARVQWYDTYTVYITKQGPGTMNVFIISSALEIGT